VPFDTTPNNLSDNPTTRYTYDQAGQQRTMTDALGRVTTYEYDELGRMVKTIFHDKTFVTQEYDKLGRRVAAVDQNGKRTEYRYDDLGRLTGVKDALNQWTEYGYNELGQLVYQEDALDRRTYYEYDKLGRRTATVLPMTQRSTMTYDEIGNLKTVADFNGRTITYSYDQLNRLTQKSFQDGTRVVYTYTQNGLRDTIAFKNANGATTEFYDWDYDERDRLVRRVDEIYGMQRSIGYTYDVAGNRTSVTTGSGTVNYTFDERNRLDRVLQGTDVLADYDYDAIGNLTRTQFKNGTEEIRQYDDLNRLKSLTNRSAGNVLSKFTYTLDEVGNRTQVTEHDGRQVKYTYDDLYRLTREEIDEVTAADSQSEAPKDRAIEYSYDLVGNRRWKKETVSSTTTQTDYDYDANDRLLWEKMNGVTTTTYTYDNNGSTRTKVENGVTTTYTWNDDKRLIAATIVDGSATPKQLQYRYNDDGIRVSSTVNGEETRYLLDEVQAYPQVLEEYAPNGTVQVSYVYGHDLISQTQGGQTTHYHVDGLGSTTELTNANGEVVSRSRYDAFGNAIAQTSNIGNKYGFAGEQFDSNLDSYYLRDRFYDSQSGRFLRQDIYQGRQSKPLTLHKYSYTHNNPVNGTDPTGFFTMGEFAVADSIRNILAGMQATSGGYLISASLHDGEYGLREFLTDTAWNALFAVLPIAVSYAGQKLLSRGASSLPPLGARGSVSGREFDPLAAGGAIKQLSMRNVKITHKGVDKVVEHVKRFDYDPGNEHMIQRLRAIASGKQSPTQVDLNYYTHELREGFRYKKLGIPKGQQPMGEMEARAVWNNAHTATLEEYAVMETDLYHPDALRASERYWLKQAGLR
jgi:RHS repeat-associated protein